MSIIYKFPENIPYDVGEDDIYRFRVDSTYDLRYDSEAYIIDNDEENCLVTVGKASVCNKDLTRGQDFWYWFRYDSPYKINNLGSKIELNKEYLIFNIGDFCLYLYTPDNINVWMKTSGAKDKKLEDKHIGISFTDMVHQPFFAHCYDTLVCYTNTKNKQNDIIKVYYIPEVAEKSSWSITGGFSEFKGSKLDQYVLPGEDYLQRIVYNNENPINCPYRAFEFE